ncbi:MAG TPA: RNA polymerase sigma factor [Tepidisphaeraceae bacterium]|nr:RNA polymerase sigma factor [Tepidisphaeraceae bacterium]
MSISPSNHRRPLDAAEEKAQKPQPGTEAMTDKWPASAQPDRIPPEPLPGEPFTDEQLLDSYRHGSKAGFSQLVERYQRELFHFLVRFLGDRAAAEDVFQETFLQVHQSAAQFDPERRFRPWLFTIAANKARDLMRSQARRPANPLQAAISPGDDESGQFIDLMESMAAPPGENLEKEELQKMVHDTVMGMPDHLREILLLSYFHQFPYKQISDILAIPLGTVKSRLHAAVAHFADRWRALQENKSPAR